MTATTEEWSPGEIRRALSRLETGIGQLGKKLDDQAENFVRKDVYEAERRAIAAATADLTARVSAASNWVKGIVLTLIGALAAGGGTYALRLH